MVWTLTSEVIPLLMNKLWVMVIAFATILNMILFGAAFLLLILFLKYVTKTGSLSVQFCDIVLYTKMRE